jgi:hypothetical protein
MNGQLDAAATLSTVNTCITTEHSRYDLKVCDDGKLVQSLCFWMDIVQECDNCTEHID